MNKIWFGMLFIGFVCCAAGAEGSGGFESLTQEMLASGEEAVYFVIGLVGIMGMWSGFMNIARGSGLIHALARKSRGLMTRLFPKEKNEDTLMLMLMAIRKMKRIMQRAEINDFSLPGIQGGELHNFTVGVLGTGRIGRAVIRDLSGFGCRIYAYDAYENEEVKKYAEYVSFDELLTNSDIITLHVPGNAENTHLIDEAAFKKMKDGVIIVNTARGLIVDTQALIAALKSGKVGFAALDTFEGEAGLYYLNKETEKLDNDNMAVLKSFPNVILSPHMAFYTEQAVSDMVENSIKGILGLENGDNSLEVM